MAEFGFYEFFAGGGMARAGLGPGWRCLFANDFDPKKAASYRANWGGEGLHVGDVAALTASVLPSRADLVWASFPCQDLSLAGAGAGLKGERSGAFWPFWRLMRELRQVGRAPKAIVLENVCGLLTSHGGRDFVELCNALAEGGYRFGAMVIDAALFVPQSRPRLFVVALDAAGPVPRMAKLGPNRTWHPSALRAAHDRMPQVTASKWLWLAPALPAKRNTALIDLIQDDPEHVPWHDDVVTEHLLAMMSATNRRKVLEAQLANRRVVGAVYKRTRVEAGKRVQRAEVRFDGLSGCLRTPGGGSSRQTILMVEGGRIKSRLISARETARLMGLPDDYVLPKAYNEAYHLTGDGLVVPVVRYIAEEIVVPMMLQSDRQPACAA